MEKAIKFKRIIDKEGIVNLAEQEFRAGFYSEKEFNQAINWLKQNNWDKINLIIQEDNKVLNEPEPKCKTKREKNQIDAALNKRLRNVFTRSDFARLNIKEMSYAEAEKLCVEKEQERLKYGIKF